ncbi:MAG: tetratricopeptide repeat protein [Pseudomonadota bacterium]
MGLFEHLTSSELFALAQFELSKEDLSNAFIKLKALIAREDCPVSAHSAIARCYARLQLFSLAEQHFAQFIKENPNAFVEKFQLGLTILDQNRKEEALTLWDEILRETPNFPPILYHKALVFARDGQVDAAKNLLKELFANTASDNFYFNKGKELSDALQNANQGEAIQKQEDSRELPKGAYQDITKH